MNAEVLSFFEVVRPDVDMALESLIPSAATEPTEIHSAMRYSLLAGGKRLRPALCVAAYSLYHDDYRPVLPAAAALEMAHTYSLIHDDLPSMDDDDFRRGKPSCHKQYGEATAILAGDALLTLAFETLASCDHFPAERITVAMARFARALGTRDGMIAGQVLDLASEGRTLTPQELEAIHRSKTGALLSTSVWLGAWLGGAPQDELFAIDRFGITIGLAFQIVDDILDETESLQTLGKTAGKDRQKRKATYPALFGIDGSRRAVRELTARAREDVASFGRRAELLSGISEYLENRCH